MHITHTQHTHTDDDWAMMDGLCHHLEEQKVEKLFMISQHMQQEGYDSDVLLQDHGIDVMKLDMNSSISKDTNERIFI